MARSFYQLSPKAQLVVFALLCVLTVAGAWQVLLGPAGVELETRRARLQTLETELTRVQAIAGKLPVVEREVRALEIALRETTAVIPDEKDPQDVLRNLHEMASESALDIASFAPKPIVTKTQYSEWPIQLGFEGTYHDLARFFERLATMSRLMSVSELTIKTRQRPNGRGTISATCVATTFVFRKDVPVEATTSVGGRP
jgi:type IV pilus assembly protein PilO